MLITLLIIALVVVDQVLKFWVRANIPLGAGMPFLPGVMELTYVQNTGAAFSIMAAHTWLLTLISAVVAVALAVCIYKKVVRHPMGLISLAAVLAGAIGNLIDRAWLGYVTDMFKTTFMNFAVFNIADICVVCGGIVFAVYYIFFYDKWEGKGAEHHDDTSSAT